MARVYRAARDPRIVPLGRGVARPGALAHPAAQPGARALLAREAGEAGHPEYDLPPGCPGCGSSWRAARWTGAARWTPEDFVITCGASEALHLACAPWRAPATPSRSSPPPTTARCRPSKRSGCARWRFRATRAPAWSWTRWRPRWAGARVAAVLVVPSFSNPLGSCMPEEHRERLVACSPSARCPSSRTTSTGTCTSARSARGPRKALDTDGHACCCAARSPRRWRRATAWAGWRRAASASGGAAQVRADRGHRHAAPARDRRASSQQRRLRQTPARAAPAARLAGGADGGRPWPSTSPRAPA